MSRVRFTTARSVSETFPGLAAKLSVAPTDDPPLVFLNSLSAQGKFEDAVAFCAHLLPRREAVWWGCGTARDFLGDLVPGQAAGLVAAENWVHEPNDRNRLHALQIATSGEYSDPLTWLAFGAGWSGGMLSSIPKPPVPVPPYLTARALRVAILLSSRHVSFADRPHRLQACIAAGLGLAEPDDGHRGGPSAGEIRHSLNGR
jgi:hypothetical protein